MENQELRFGGGFITGIILSVLIWTIYSSTIFISSGITDLKERDEIYYNYDDQLYKLRVIKNYKKSQIVYVNNLTIDSCYLISYDVLNRNILEN